ncbi:MAG: PKD domain-containing protein [Ferruginibacter sp.]|nr:PKD domain-containing protein [Ferruginibacter sp.]
MKYNFLSCAKTLIIVAGFASSLASCTYKENVDFPYEESIYMPAAGIATGGAGANGIFTITPTMEGLSYRYLADKASSKFDIPLSVTRSGVNRSGSIPVNIITNTDTINKLIAAGKFSVAADPLLTTEVLPTKYTLPTSVLLSGDSTLASFNLSIDLTFMTNSAINFPKKRYAIAVGINSPGVKVDSLKKLTVIFIDPASVILPTSNFSSFVDGPYKTASFINTSLNGTAYSWDFGDGTPVLATASATHKYSAGGNYTVTLTAIGITGTISVKTSSVAIP